jgi:hypothetical protein
VPNPVDTAEKQGRMGPDLSPRPASGHTGSAPARTSSTRRPGRMVFGLVGATVLVVGGIAAAVVVDDNRSPGELASGALASSTLPEPTTVLLEETFDGDGVFVDQDLLWDGQDEADGRDDDEERERADSGANRDDAAASVDGDLVQVLDGGDPDWFAEAGEMVVEDSAGLTDSSVFRMWTQRTDLAFTQVEMNVTFDGWSGGDEPWHGVNLWLNRSLCTPVPECGAVDDPGGNSGYVLDFLNRDGSMTILKKVSGDTRDRWEGATEYVQGGTYYELASERWESEAGRMYRFSGRAAELQDGSVVLQVEIDGDVVLEAVDDASVAGAPLTGGRVGLRSDNAVLSIDDLSIRR